MEISQTLWSPCDKTNSQIPLPSMVGDYLLGALLPIKPTVFRLERDLALSAVAISVMKSHSCNNKLIKQSCYNRFLISFFFHLWTRIPLGNNYYRFDDFPYIIATVYFSHEHELRISQIWQFFGHNFLNQYNNFSKMHTAMKKCIKDVHASTAHLFHKIL